MYSTREIANSNQQVVEALNKAIDTRLEGIVVKSPDSVYKPSVRSGSGWFKVKPDYMLGLNDDLDLIIIGGYYGVGRRSGLISHFLTGVAVDDVNNKTSTSSTNNYANAEPSPVAVVAKAVAGGGGDDEDELDFEGTSGCDDEENKNEPAKNSQSAPLQPMPTLFYSFTKAGSGYSMKELRDFNQKLADKWKPFDKKNPPNHIQVVFLFLYFSIFNKKLHNFCSFV